MSSAVAIWLAALAATDPAPSDSVRLCVRDAVTEAPIVGATVRGASPPPQILLGDCVRVSRRAGAIEVLRIGYRPQRLRLAASGADSAGDDETMVIRLEPSTGQRSRLRDEAEQTPTVLATQRVTANAPVPVAAGAIQASLSTDVARDRGIVTMNGLIGLLPYTTLRSARGESGLSLRGARREQVVITLDGLPLNDPATGIADVGDVPLVAIQSATVTPGADPVGAGGGASGGVLALTSAAERLVTMRSGAFGAWAGEAAWTGRNALARWNASVSHRRAANDFPFLNDGGVAPNRETRVNNDEQRTVLSAGLLTARTQWAALLSTGERGMVGAANVRAYDEDRSRSTRLLLRNQTALGTSVLTAGVRRFALSYRDPGQPELDSRATVWASDLEWRGSAPFGTWRVGGGADALAGTGNVAQRRARGFAAWGWQRTATARARLQADVGVRVDAVERHGVQPTGSVGATWRVAGTRQGSSLNWLARSAQAVRVPTLYDLYFSSPQRLAVRPLSPERVTLDVGTGLQGAWQRPRLRMSGELQLVARDTRDAIVWFPGNFGWSPANVGRERLRGTEARVEVGTAVATVSVWHTWYRSALRSGALTIPMPYVPQHTGALQGAWRVGASTFSGVVRLQGRRPFTAGPRDPRFELPAVALADVAWSRPHDFAQVRALVSVTLENLADVRWQSVRGFPMPGRGWSAALTLQPRS